MVLGSADFVFHNQFVSCYFFLKWSFGNISRVPSRLDPDHVRRFVGPDLGPNCLKR